MATLTSTPTLSKAESRRLYSWWWDSHIPKNSKWLQENLTDMDMRVKAMIKLIEEDADSFARRAEMYYKKRPELMKLVEEFYRAYRALAERYDHATGALRQAQKTMSEAFPNQIPFALADESPSESSASELEPYTPAALPPMNTVFGKHISQKDASGASASSSGERNGTYTDEADVQSGKKGFKHLTEMFSDGGARKGLTFNEEDKKGSGNETCVGQKSQKIGADEGKAKKIQELSQLSAENRNLKDQISTESKDKSKAESEVQWLQRAHTKLESEKEEALLQFQQSLRKIASLEVEMEKFRAQNAEVLIKISKLDSTEEKCQLLEKEKQSILLTTSELEKKTNEQQEELMHMQDELDKLKIELKDEHMRCVHTEAALASLETLHSQSLEALRISALEMEKGVQLLKETDARKQYLKEEFEKVKEEIQNLNHENVSSQEMIKTLQDQISILKEEKKNRENEVEHQKRVKKSLDEELDRLKEEIHDLQSSHKGITDKIEAIGLHAGSFQESVKEMQDANLKLSDMCMKKEVENVLLLEKLKQMQEITEKNTLLEISLSDANVELENLRLKIKELEESCECLQEKSSTLESEKKELVILIDTVTSNIEELTEKNTYLENSLSDAVFELEGLRVMLKSLEESCQSLEDDKSKLQNERESLISQVGLMGNSLEDMGNRFSELQELYSNLEREKETKDGQLAVLQDLFKVQKEQYETLVHTSNARLASLEDEISRLHAEGEHREELFQDEQLKLFAAEIEILIIRKCLYDLRDKNLSLSKEWQKMEQYILRQKEKEELLLDHIGRLKKVMYMVWKALNANEECRIVDGAEELYLQYILDRIEAMQNSVRSVEDEKQSLLLEKSVYITLLQQLGHLITDLRLEKNDLYQDSRKKAEELLLLQSERSELVEMNKQFTNISEAGQQREEMLEEEMKILGRKTLNLQEAHSLSQDENQKLLVENEQLSRRFSNLKEDIHLLEEEYTAIFSRAIVLDSLSVVLKQFGSQRIEDLKILNDDFDQFKRSKDHLEYKIMEMGEKMQVVEVENFHLKNLAVKLEECREHLTILAVDMSMAKTVNEELNGQIQQLDQLIENRNHLLMKKDMLFSEVDQSFQELQNQNTRLHEMLEAMKLELGDVTVVRDELEKKIVIFVETMVNKDKEISLALDTNKIISKELQRLDKENKGLRTKEKELVAMWLNQVSCCEEEFAALCSDIQIANVHAVLFEEKVLEVMRVCESLETRNLVEREASFDELLSKGAQIEELKVKLNSIAGKNREMKTELNEYTSIVSSLVYSISSLEDLILPLRKTLPSDPPKLQDQQSGDGDKEIEGSEEEGSEEDMRCERPQVILELQNLLVKVEAIREALMEARIPVVLDNLGDTCSERGKVLGSTTDSRKSTGKDEEMKDIQLDQVSSSSKFDFDDGTYGISNADSNIVDDQMLRLWDEDYNDKNYGFEVGAQKGRHPSSGKELGVDKLLLPRKKVKDLSQEWNKEVIEKLSSDAGRLNAVQEGIQELKIKMEKSEDTNLPKSFEFEAVKIQLKDAEATILHLAETNRKLIRKAQVCSTSSVSSIEDQDETKNEKKKVSEHARRGSDKIGRLELELQKLQYILLKLEEEYENHRARAAERKSRVILKDYLYGRRDRRRKRGHFCGCIGSTASDD